MQGFARRKQGSQVVSGVSIPLMSAFHAAETAHTHTRKTILQCARECTSNYNLNSLTLSMYIQLVIATIKSSCVVTGCE